MSIGPEHNNNEAQRPGRRELRKARNRARLLRAAEQLFTEKGFHDTSPGEIAELADLGHGTFYSFFSDKQDCHHQLVCEKRSELLELLETGLAGKSGLSERLETVIRIIVEASFRQPEIVRLGITDLHLLQPGDQDSASFVDYWAPRLAALLSSPGEAPIPAWPVGYLLAGHMVTVMALTQSRHIEEAQARALLSERLTSLFAGVLTH